MHQESPEKVSVSRDIYSTVTKAVPIPASKRGDFEDHMDARIRNIKLCRGCAQESVGMRSLSQKPKCIWTESGLIACRYSPTANMWMPSFNLGDCCAGTAEPELGAGIHAKISGLSLRNRSLSAVLRLIVGTCLYSPTRPIAKASRPRTRYETKMPLGCSTFSSKVSVDGHILSAFKLRISLSLHHT